MADQSQKTEQPTQKRQDKARSEGNFANAKDFVGALQLLAFTTILSAWGGEWFSSLQYSMYALLQHAFTREITGGDWVHLGVQLLSAIFLPLGVAGATLLGVTLAFQLAVTKMGFSLKKLTPDFKRLNPLPKLKELPKQNGPALVQAILLIGLFGALVHAVAMDNIAALFMLPLTSVQSGWSQIADLLMQVIWKLSGIIFLFGAIDLFRQKRKFSGEMRMSKQEVRDEMKESEGSPEIKMRIRRNRRDLLRRRMMKDVDTATAVIVNPTHYAVAIRYQMDSLEGPRVVAKGKNYLALRIKQRALDHDVPIVENPPLARALYAACEVGQEIPADFYRAVAEILAYIYRMMNYRR